MLLGLNVVGYYGLFVGLEIKRDAEMSHKFDSEPVDESQLTTIIIPITIPYATDSRGYERVDGKFEYNGEFYRMFKRRITGDAIYLICMKDQQTKQMNKALVDYLKTYSDKTSDSKPHTTIFKSFIKEYLSHSLSITNQSSGWGRDLTPTPFIFYSTTFYPSFITPPEEV